MFLSSTAASHCLPDTDNGCSQYISPCFYNQSRGLLQQCFWQCQCCSFVSAPIGVARCCVRHHAERKYDHISATIDQLHWLPVKRPIDRQLCTLIYKCLHNVTPVYLRDMCIPVSSISGRSRLRSAADGDLWHQRTRTETFGPRAFAVLGPSIWNTLPATVRDPLLHIRTILQ